MPARAGRVEAGGRRPAALSLVLGLLAGFLVLLPCRARAAEGTPCANRGTAVVIGTGLHLLWLCEQGKATAEFKVALGKGGTDKRQEGDLKTPTGVYPLGSPHDSAKFHLFLPIGYPTAAQRAQGYTGGAVGIHGPHRRTRQAGALNTAIDWTRGCIAVGSDAEIEQIVTWVRKLRPAKVYLD